MSGNQWVKRTLVNFNSYHSHVGRWLADCPALSFRFVYLHSKQISKCKTVELGDQLKGILTMSGDENVLIMMMIMIVMLVDYHQHHLHHISADYDVRMLSWHLWWSSGHEQAFSPFALHHHHRQLCRHHHPQRCSNHHRQRCCNHHHHHRQ